MEFIDICKTVFPQFSSFLLKLFEIPSRLDSRISNNLKLDVFLFGSCSLEYSTSSNGQWNELIRFIELPAPLVLLSGIVRRVKRGVELYHSNRGRRIQSPMFFRYEYTLGLLPFFKSQKTGDVCFCVLNVVYSTFYTKSTLPTAMSDMS